MIFTCLANFGSKSINLWFAMKFGVKSIVFFISENINCALSFIINNY